MFALATAFAVLWGLSDILDIQPTARFQRQFFHFLIPQSGAMLAHMGQPDIDSVSYQTLQTQPYPAVPINGSNDASNTLTLSTVAAIKTIQVNTNYLTKNRLECAL
jgi:hypothetical protein